MFGLLVIIWLILNDLLSILENAGRMGVNLPSFLVKVLSDMQNELENTMNQRKYLYDDLLYNKKALSTYTFNFAYQLTGFLFFHLYILSITVKISLNTFYYSVI